MIKNLIILGATVLTTSVCAVEKFTISLPQPIIVDQGVATGEIESGFKASVDLTVLQQAGAEWFDTII
jgi:hypothetical protein